MLLKMNYAKVVFTYDELGNMTSEKYFDTKELGVIPNDARYSQVLNEYDEKGRLISEEYYDEFDNPALNREGYAAHMISYADSGLIQEEYYLGDDEEPIAIADGYSRRVLISESKYYKADGSPAIGPEGSSTVIREYTSRGDVSLIQYYDENRSSIAVNGVYGIRKEYNAYANLELETWLGADGEPALNDEGYASIWYDYDLSNSANVEKYFQYYRDTEGNDTAARNGAWGVSYLYYPVTLIHRVTYIDQNGAPIMTDQGYAIMEYQEDDNGEKIWEGYYDESEAQTNCLDGYSSVEREFDSKGRLISEKFRDRYNKLTNNTDGIANWNGYYNDDGELVVTNCYDKDLNPVTAP